MGTKKTVRIEDLFAKIEQLHLSHEMKAQMYAEVKSAASDQWHLSILESSLTQWVADDAQKYARSQRIGKTLRFGAALLFLLCAAAFVGIVAFSPSLVPLLSRLALPFLMIGGLFVALILGIVRGTRQNEEWASEEASTQRGADWLGVPPEEVRKMRENWPTVPAQSYDRGALGVLRAARRGLFGKDDLDDYQYQRLVDLSQSQVPHEEVSRYFREAQRTTPRTSWQMRLVIAGALIVIVILISVCASSFLSLLLFKP